MESLVARRETRLSTPESIDHDLRVLWREVAAQAPVTRAVMANLVVFLSGRGDAIHEIPLDEVVSRHPSRVIVLRHSGAGAPAQRPTDTAISIVSFGPPQARYAVEEIAIAAPCGDASLASIVRRFTRGDVPTTIWLAEDVSTVPPIPALTRMGRQLVFDSGRWRDIGRAVAVLSPLLQGRSAPRLIDVNWRRISPLRQALIHAAGTQPRREPIARARIRHRPGDAALAWLLAGWMASRLGWTDGSWPIEIDEERQGDTVLSLEAGPVTVSMNGRRVLATAAGTPGFQLAARRDSPGAAIAAELATLARDVCYDGALAALARQPALG
jgi:glucose-6-phosphate dehydrogenase assembly protein OpcA